MNFSLLSLLFKLKYWDLLYLASALTLQLDVKISCFLLVALHGLNSLKNRKIEHSGNALKFAGVK